MSGTELTSSCQCHGIMSRDRRPAIHCRNSVPSGILTPTLYAYSRAPVELHGVRAINALSRLIPSVVVSGIADLKTEEKKKVAGELDHDRQPGSSVSETPNPLLSFHHHHVL